jgi:hypothetical protein
MPLRHVLFLVTPPALIVLSVFQVTTVFGQQFRRQFYFAVQTAIGDACALDDPVQNSIAEDAYQCALACLQWAAGCSGFNFINVLTAPRCQLFQQPASYYGNVSGCTSYLVRSIFLSRTSIYP